MGQAKTAAIITANLAGKTIPTGMFSGGRSILLGYVYLSFDIGQDYEGHALISSCALYRSYERRVILSDFPVFVDHMYKND